MATARNPQLRIPRLAEMVASTLRNRILSGEVEDGTVLPKQEELLEEFNVSMPSIREALRILETEGLVTVQRGSTGGSVVHRPQAERVGYMMGLVLQSQSVALEDIVAAVQLVQPTCVRACATRPDRKEQVVPHLRETIERSRDVLADGDQYARLARSFHTDIVTLCGNRTMMLMMGALESLWSAHFDTFSPGTARHSSFTDVGVRKETLRQHERILRHISDGNTTAAERAAREHYSQPWEHPYDRDMVVDAALLAQP